MSDNTPSRWPPTCREIQDAAIADLRLAINFATQADDRHAAAIADLQVTTGYAQAASARLTRELADLAQRVAVLEARQIWTATSDPATITWTGDPPPLYTPGYEEETP